MHKIMLYPIMETVGRHGLIPFGSSVGTKHALKHTGLMRMVGSNELASHKC